MVCPTLTWGGYDYGLDVLAVPGGLVTIVGVLTSHDQDITHPLPMDMQIVPVLRDRPECAIEARTLHGETTEQRHLVIVPVALSDGMQFVRDPRHFHRGGGYLMPGDSRMSALLRDLAGTAYDPAVPFHDRFEG